MNLVPAMWAEATRGGNPFGWRLGDPNGRMMIVGGRRSLSVVALYMQCHKCLRQCEDPAGEFFICQLCNTKTPLGYRRVEFTLEHPRDAVRLPALLRRLMKWHPALFQEQRTEIRLEEVDR